MRGFIIVYTERGFEQTIAVAQIKTVSPDTYNRVGAYISLVGGGTVESRDSFDEVNRKIEEATCAAS